jgi:hypothetical protein
VDRSDQRRPQHSPPPTSAVAGQQFGGLIYLGPAGRDGKNRLLWLCRCNCGTEQAFNASNVKRGKSKSCGCGRGGKDDLTGKRFGSLTALSEAGRDRTRSVLWRCACDCGGERIVAAGYLNAGDVQSCGCVNRSKTHGQTSTALYVRWKAMIQRTTNPNATAYAEYGGRGITVCSEWRQFEGFARDMGPTFSPDLSIERVDVNGGYAPSNCVWAPQAQQARNRRNNKQITFQGVTMVAADWAEYLGLNRKRLYSRLAANWPIERALTEGADPAALARLAGPSSSHPEMTA